MKVCKFFSVATLVAGGSGLAANAAQMLPTERPALAASQVLVNGTSTQRAQTAIAVCQNSFRGFKSGKLVASMGAAVSDFHGWVPGKAQLVAPQFLSDRLATEGVALCYVDGTLGAKEPSAPRRALYLVASDGVPVLYAIGPQRDLQVLNPAIKLGRTYSISPKDDRVRPKTTTPLDPATARSNPPVATIPDEGSPGTVPTQAVR